MALTYTITQQEYQLLDLVAEKEEVKHAPDVYMSMNPNTFDPVIPTLTLEQLEEFQTDRIRSVGASAAGRYQFIRKTLFGTSTEPGLVQNLGLPRNLVFNAVLQDYLALVLLQGASLERWQADQLTWDDFGAKTNDSDAAFQIKLSRVWAAIPVPMNIPAIPVRDKNGNIIGTRKVFTGDSFYEGDAAGNSSGMAADVMYRQLRALRINGPIQKFTLDLETSSRAHPITGVTALSQAQIAAGGGQTYHGQSANVPRNTYQGGPVADGLPPVDNPYKWDKIHQLDNRYDFRTGKKVRDLLYNGVQPVAASAYADNNGRSPVPDVGDDSNGVAEVAAAARGGAAGPDDGLRGAPPLPNFDQLNPRGF